MKNILRGFNEMLDVEHVPALGAERVKYLNAVVLDGLKLDEGVPAAVPRSRAILVVHVPMVSYGIWHRW